MNRLAVCILVSSGRYVGLASDIPQPRPVDIAALVRQLGSEDFAEREEASRRLSMLSVDAPPTELLAALMSPNPEIRDRARRAVKALEEHIDRNRERIALSDLPRGERFAKSGQIALYVASTAANELNADNDRLWRPAFEVGTIAASKAGLKGEYLPGGPMRVKDFPTYRKNVINDKLICTNGMFARGENEYFLFRGAVLAAGVSEPQKLALEGLVVSRGAVIAGQIDRSLILATGNVTARHEMHSTAVICDGDVQAYGNIRGCFIIARGSIVVEKWGHLNTLIAGGTVTIKKPVHLPGNQTISNDMENVIKEKVIRPLGYITFFELSTVGVEVKSADEEHQGHRRG